MLYKTHHGGHLNVCAQLIQVKLRKVIKTAARLDSPSNKEYLGLFVVLTTFTVTAVRSV
jgi:hypothetical protein